MIIKNQNKNNTQPSYMGGSTARNVEGSLKSDKQITAHQTVFLSQNPYFFQHCLE